MWVCDLFPKEQAAVIEALDRILEEEEEKEISLLLRDLPPIVKRRRGLTDEEAETKYRAIFRKEAKQAAREKAEAEGRRDWPDVDAERF